MSFLIDTNIISEVRKGERCNAAVAAWWAGVAEDDLWLSALVVGEIRKGVELARRRDPRKAEVLERWLSDVLSGFGDRVLPVDAIVAEEWGRMNAIRPVSVIDALLAATAMLAPHTLIRGRPDWNTGVKRTDGCTNTFEDESCGITKPATSDKEKSLSIR